MALMVVGAVRHWVSPYCSTVAHCPSFLGGSPICASLTAALYVPLGLVPFVRTGPFAWHGVLNFWAVFVMFFVLIVIVTPYAFRAVRHLEHEDLAYGD
jgi:hypothetical protein